MCRQHLNTGTGGVSSSKGVRTANKDDWEGQAANQSETGNRGHIIDYGGLSDKLCKRYCCTSERKLWQQKKFQQL